jgi:hypothetical protein
MISSAFPGDLGAAFDGLTITGRETVFLANPDMQQLIRNKIM